MTQTRIPDSPDYFTADINLAAYLIASGKAELLDIQCKVGQWKKSFRLSSKPSEAEIAAYYSGGADVPAKRMADTIRGLKAALASQEVRHV